MTKRVYLYGVGCLGAVIAMVAALPVATPLAAGRQRAPVSAPAAGAPAAPAAAAPVAAGAAQYRPVLDKYCVTCHNEKRKNGQLALDTADLSNMKGQAAENWERVARKLRTREMPPANMPRPDEATYDGLVMYLETSLDAAAATNPDPGRPSLHRMNRTEYANAIRDLLNTQIDAAELLPADDSTHGFDNVADVLGVSPVLLESYVVAAHKISRLAIGDPLIPAQAETYRAPRDETQDYPLEGLPLGTRGGLAFTHNFPLDGEYEIRVRLAQSQLMQIRGLLEPHDLEVAIDGQRVQLFHIDGGPQMYDQKFYDGPTLSQTADENLHFRVTVKAGPRAVTAAFPMRSEGLDESLKQPTLKSYVGSNDTYGLPHIDRVIITGPFKPGTAGDTPSRTRIFQCRPAPGADDTACARQILSTLGRRAYRGMFSDADLAKLMDFYKSGKQQGGFEAGVEMALWRLLASPQFVFRFEPDPPNLAPGSAYKLSDLELASRLSFFLWSSIPDDELLDVASRNRLSNRTVLDQQVKRMLNDPKSKAFVENFAGQWLFLRNLDHTVPNTDLFPNFDDNLRQAFRTETEMLFEHILRNNRSMLDFLNADYTFVNDRLAKHYGIPNVRGGQFRMVPVTDENRRGLLGQGSVLTVTSYANRTSVVQRGKWVMENIMGSPPPPPPPNVPQLKEGKQDGRVLTMREKMAEHRANPVCASCHSKLDPLGFALENFDAVGAWRDTDAEHTPIDASGQMPDGTKFVGPVGLRKALMAHPDRFVMATTQKLMTYALGRGLDYHDMPVARAIMREAAASNYTMTNIIMGIIHSAPFQMRRTEEAPAPSTTSAGNQ